MATQGTPSENITMDIEKDARVHIDGIIGMDIGSFCQYYMHRHRALYSQYETNGQWVCSACAINKNIEIYIERITATDKRFI
jgi:hypothetical protein